MKSMLKRVGKLSIVMILASLVLFGLLVLVCCIPRSAIQKHSEESADYFSNHELFDIKLGDFAMFMQDNYADCIVFNIIYCMDETHPVTAVLLDNFRDYPNMEVNDAYREVVHDTDKTPNAEYSRYWHGSILFIKPLLCLGSVSFVRIVLGAMVVLLVLENMALLIKEKHTDIAVIYLLGLLAVQFWMIFTCLEYWSVFLIMQLAIMAVIGITKNRSEDKIVELSEILFLLVGITTAFMDFLTAETLTYSMAMLILLMILMKQERLPQGMKLLWLAVKTGGCWIVGYAYMFLLKWVLAAMVSHSGTTELTLEAVVNRFTGTVTADGYLDSQPLGVFERITTLLTRNLGCPVLFSSKMTPGTVLIIVLGLLLVAFLVWYYFRYKKYNRYQITVFAILAILPYFRFMVLSNHAFMHYFFTYRAQMVTICCIMWIIYDTGLRKRVEKHRIKNTKH